jgi:two-component system chemotaxis sensor kinase CheA
VDDLTREFLLESREGLDRMERCLTDLETRPGDTELLAEIFRSVHTIKGTTGFLGFSRLEALSHAGENLLGLLREGELAASPDIVSGLLALMDILRGVLQSIDTTGAEGESLQADSAMIARLEELQRGDASVARRTGARRRRGRAHPCRQAPQTARHRPTHLPPYPRQPSRYASPG